MVLSLTKQAEIGKKAPGLLSLAKTAATSLDKSGLGGTVAKVALVLDYSGSMRNEYSSGNMQRLAEKVLALGVNLDDDGAIDFFVFDNSAAHLGELTLDNYQGGVNRLIGKRHMGLTDYASAFRAVRDHFFPGAIPAAPKKGLFGGLRKAEPAPNAGPADAPVYVLFLTDGAPSDKAEAVRAISEVSTTPIFFKFLSIGRESIPFLEKLDDLQERFVDNADYKPVGDVNRVGDQELFDMMMDEYPGWLKDVRAKGLIK